MATYHYGTAFLHIDEVYDDTIRLYGLCRQDKVPHDMTEATLSVSDDMRGERKIGPYPAKVGSHWSDQPRGRAGYYLLFGPIPIADLDADWQREVREWREMAGLCADS